MCPEEMACDDVNDMQMGKRRRQYLIERILTEQAVGRQDQIVERLAELGIRSTQATVSRDLEELGAIKVRAAGAGSVYAIPNLPELRVSSEDHLCRLLGEWVVEVGRSGNLVCLKTPPGTAHVVASALDRAALSGILATLAGDDTVLVVTAEGHDSLDVANRLLGLAGLPEISPAHDAHDRHDAHDQHNPHDPPDQHNAHDQHQEEH